MKPDNTSKTQRKKLRASLLSSLLCLLLLAPSATADGIPFDKSGRTLDCPKSVLTLNKAQIASLNICSILMLDSAQKKKIERSTGYQPRFLYCRTLTQAKNTCTCELIDIGILRGANKVEVPHFLLRKFRPDYYLTRNDLIYGFIDKSGQWVIKPIFRDESDFSDGYASVNTSPYHRWHDPEFVDKAGNLASEKKRNLLQKKYSTGNGLILECNLAGKFGYTDMTGNSIIPSRFIYALPFSEGLAPVSIAENRWGFIDRKGELVLAANYQEAHQFKEGRALVKGLFKNKEVWFFINKSGSKIGPYCSEAHEFTDGIAVVELARNPKRQLAIMKADGKVIGVEADELGEPAEGLIPYVVQNRAGFIDYQGKVKIPARYQSVGSFSDGLAPFTENGALGFINKNGTVVIAPRFKIQDSRGPLLSQYTTPSFKNGLAPVKADNQKMGFINQHGQFVIAPKFEKLAPFSEGLAAAAVMRKK